MDQDKQHDIALMRYSVISPIISGLQENYSSLEAFYRDAAGKGTIAPDGTLKHFAPATIERWYRNYRRGGFDALIPEGRVDEQERYFAFVIALLFLFHYGRIRPLYTPVSGLPFRLQRECGLWCFLPTRRAI